MDNDAGREKIGMWSKPDISKPRSEGERRLKPLQEDYVDLDRFVRSHPKKLTLGGRGNCPWWLVTKALLRWDWDRKRLHRPPLPPAPDVQKRF